MDTEGVGILRIRRRSGGEVGVPKNTKATFLYERYEWIRYLISVHTKMIMLKLKHKITKKIPTTPTLFDSNS